jgi:rubrerythrin
MSEEERQNQLLKLLNQIAENTKPKPQSIDSSEHEAKRNHATIEEIESCPNCSEKFKLKDYNEKKRSEIETQLRPAILKEVKEKLKSKQLLTCDGCGEIVGKEETECPTCKGTRAH